MLTLDSVEAESGSGVASLDGRLSGEALALEVTLESLADRGGEWPPRIAAHGSRGLGELQREAERKRRVPQLSGEILGGHLELGRIALSHPGAP